MSKFWKRFKGVKVSSSCSEDLELEERGTKSGEAKTIKNLRKNLLCVDHHSSVVFAKDLKKRSEETSAINPFASLSILLQGRRRMEEYSDGREKESYKDFQDMTWNDVFYDSYDSKKLPKEHEQEVSGQTEDPLCGQVKANSTESMNESLISAEDGCDSKNENKQSKGNSKCVKSSDTSKRADNTCGRQTVSSGNNSGSSCGSGDGDDDDDDENKKRKKINEIVEADCLKEELKEQAGKSGRKNKQDLGEPDVNAKDVEHDVIEQNVPSVKRQHTPVKKQEASIKEQEASVKEQNAQVKNQEASVKEQNAAVKEQEASVKKQEASVKEQEASVKEQEASVKEQEASVKEQEVSVKEQEVSVKEQDVAVKEQEASVKKQSKQDLVMKGSISLEAAFRCYGEKCGLTDRCQNSVCYRSHQLLQHSRKCKFRAFGGCSECTQLKDSYIYHTRHCINDKCIIDRCCSIKEYLKKTDHLCPVRWSYQADNVFFGKKVEDIHESLVAFHQDADTHQPVTSQEIEEFLQSLQTPLNSISSAQHQHSLLGSSSDFQAGQDAYMYPPTRPPDGVPEETALIQKAPSKAPPSVSTFSFTGSDKDRVVSTSQCSTAGIHSRGVSMTSISLQKDDLPEGDICVQQVGNAEKIERAVPRPKNVQLLHPLDEGFLSVKDGRYDEGHEWRNVQEKDFLGRGGYGECRLCTDLPSNKLFAIKKVQKDKFESSELKIWASVSGHSVRCLDLFGAVCVENFVIMFMEYMEGGSIENVLSNLPDNRFDEYTSLYILREVLEGLDFLHSRSIIHRDIKGGNVLVNGTLTKVKLADYGAAVQLGKHEYSKQDNVPPGTENFMAPEVCRSEEHSFSADIWSTGCVKYQMLKGHPPWIDFPSVIYKVGTTKKPPEFPACSEATEDLLSQMFALIPKDRPSAKQLLRHQAFEEVNKPPEPLAYPAEYEEDYDGEDGTEGASKSFSDDEFFSFEEASPLSDANEQPFDKKFSSLDQTPPLAEDYSRHELGGHGQHFSSLNQTPPPVEDYSRHALGGLDQHFSSLNQAPPPAEDYGRHASVGHGQHFSSLNQTPPPVEDYSRHALGGLDQHFSSLNQAPPPAEDYGRHASVGHGQHFSSLNQTPPPAEDYSRHALGGLDQHFGSVDQTAPPAEDYGRHASVGHGQHFSSLNQTPPPAEDYSRHALGGLDQHFGSVDQTAPPAKDNSRHALSGLGQHFGSVDQTPPSADDYSRHALCGPGKRFGLLDETPPSIQKNISTSRTLPVDDELQRLQSDFLRMVSLDGGDVSDFRGLISPTETYEEPDDVFDEVGIFKSIAEASEETDVTHSPGSYSMKELTKIDLYDPDGSLLFTVREKSSCTFGNLAENVHSKVQEKNKNLLCFTFAFKCRDDPVVDPNQELGFLNHVIKVLPASDNHDWTWWRVDQRGIVELKQD